MPTTTTYPICVICKIKLDNLDQYLFKCSNCRREYILDYEVMAYTDNVGTAYDDEVSTIETEGIAAASGPRLETQDNELDFSTATGEYTADNNINNNKNKITTIPIPHYMKSIEGKKVIDYHEE